MVKEFDIVETLSVRVEKLGQASNFIEHLNVCTHQGTGYKVLRIKIYADWSYANQSHGMVELFDHGCWNEVAVKSGEALLTRHLTNADKARLSEQAWFKEDRDHLLELAWEIL